MGAISNCIKNFYIGFKLAATKCSENFRHTPGIVFIGVVFVVVGVTVVILRRQKLQKNFNLAFHTH